MVRLLPARAQAFVLVLFASALVAALAGCGSGENGSGSAPAATAKQASEKTAQKAAPGGTKGAAKDDARRTVTVRLSGTEGTVYAGNYGNIDKSKYAEGVLETKPVEFTVAVHDSGFDVVTASFIKPTAGDGGLLKVEILSDGKVVASEDTQTQYGALNVTWSSGG